MFGSRGLLFGAPIALVALVAAVWLAKDGRGAVRRHAVVALVVTIPYVLLVAGWSGFATLEDPGPRYLIPALPFLAVPLAVMWDKLWRPAVVAAALGALVAVPAAFTYILVPSEDFLPDLLRRVRDRQFAPTVWSLAMGPIGIVVYALTVALVVAVLVRQVRAAESSSR
jgi:Mg/Co/Ni transporter MgtE